MPAEEHGELKGACPPALNGAEEHDDVQSAPAAICVLEVHDSAESEVEVLVHGELVAKRLLNVWVSLPVIIALAVQAAAMASNAVGGLLEALVAGVDILRVDADDNGSVIGRFGRSAQEAIVPFVRSFGKLF
jgi:hypothetical protein